MSWPSNYNIHPQDVLQDWRTICLQDLDIQLALLVLETDLSKLFWSTLCHSTSEEEPKEFL